MVSFYEEKYGLMMSFIHLNEYSSFRWFSMLLRFRLDNRKLTHLYQLPNPVLYAAVLFNLIQVSKTRNNYNKTPASNKKSLLTPLFLFQSWILQGFPECLGLKKELIITITIAFLEKNSQESVEILTNFLLNLATLRLRFLKILSYCFFPNGSSRFSQILADFL